MDLRDLKSPFKATLSICCVNAISGNMCVPLTDIQMYIKARNISFKQIGAFFLNPTVNLV